MEGLGAYCHGGGKGVPGCRVDVPMAGVVMTGGAVAAGPRQ